MAVAASVPEWLGRRALLTPDRVALGGEGGWVRYAELDAWAGRIAAALAQAGIGPHDRVGVLLEGSPRAAALVHALVRLGAVLVALHPRERPEETRFKLKASGAVAVVYSPASEDLARAAAPAIPALALSELAAGKAAPRPPRPMDLAEPLAVVFTSGTTGQPRGAVLSAGNFWWNAVSSGLLLGVVPGDMWLSAMPLAHVGGLAILMRAVIDGAAVLLLPRFDPEAVNRAIDDEGVTLTSVVPQMLQRMLEARGRRPYPARLRAALVGGGPTPQELRDAAWELGLAVAPTYGLTETASQAATLMPDQVATHPGSSGLPLFAMEIAIGRPGPADPGAEGEILVRGPQVISGYLDGAADVLEAGWLHTGDVGFLDDFGHLHVLDRRDDLIVSGGENVYPAQVEAVLAAHPDVAEAGVVGVADARWGQVPVALVVVRPGRALDGDAIRAFCGQRLAPFKVPVRIQAVAELPRTAAGKLRRARLRELIDPEVTGS